MLEENKYIEFIKKYSIYIILIISLIILTFILVLNNKPNKVNAKEEVENPLPLNSTEKQIPTSIKVDIKGEVKKPGVYSLLTESRVEDAIKKSGGLTKNADVTVINLSKKLADEMVIIIYSKKQIEQMKKGTIGIKYIEKECVCPDIKNDACIDKDNMTNDTIIKSNNTTNKTTTKTEPNTTSKVSLNKATLNELTTLTGIGESKANAIIEYRNKNNGFKTIEEIKNISGIGDKTFDKIKSRLIL